jgi:hypothetical protein
VQKIGAKWGVILIQMAASGMAASGQVRPFSGVGAAHRTLYM